MQMQPAIIANPQYVPIGGQALNPQLQRNLQAQHVQASVGPILPRCSYPPICDHQWPIWDYPL